MKRKIAIACGLLLVSLALGQGVKPERGFAPDSKTAVKIAEAVLVPVYGEKQIDSEKPLTAELQHDVWTVQGTLNCPAGEVCAGGVAVVEISKTDGHILSMTHFK